MKKINKILSLIPLVSVLGIASCNNSSCNHNFGEWIASKNGSTHERYCSICNYKEVKSHDLNKDPITIKEASCHEEGLIGYSCATCYEITEVVTPKTLNHNFGENHYVDEKNHKHTCNDCGVSSLQKHTFDIKNPDVEFLKTAPTCEEAATYYYSCSCGASSEGTVYASTFTFGNTLPHTVYDLNIAQNPNKTNYYSYEKFDPTGLKLTYSCSICGNTNIEANMDEVTYSYVKGNDSFRVNESEVYAHFNGQKIAVGGINVSKAVNEIYNLKDIEASCNEDIDLSNVKAKLGTLTLDVYDKNNVLVESENKHYSLLEEKSPYTIKASATGGDEYTEVMTITKTITVSHKYEIDYLTNESICSCGTLPVEGYFYNLDTEMVYKPNLRGEKKDIVLNGNVVDALTNEEPDYTGLKGKDKLILKATYNGESINFASTVINQLIETEDDFITLLWAENEAVDGYYVLGNDIDSIATNGFEGVNTRGELFSAVLDGDNHHINSLTISSKYGGLFGTRSFKGSALKNLYIDELKKNANNNSANGGMFGYVGDHVTLINVHVKLGSISSAIVSGVVAYADNLIKDCSFNLSNLSYACLYYAQPTKETDKVTFENTTIYYKPGVKQGIYHDITPTYQEVGINWVSLL